MQEHEIQERAKEATPEREYVPPPVTGYRTLMQSEVDAMNECKAAERSVRALIAKVRSIPGADQRNCALAETYAEDAFMRLVRAIARPTS